MSSVGRIASGTILVLLLATAGARGAGAAEPLIYPPEVLAEEVARMPPPIDPAEVPVPYAIDAAIRAHVDELLEGINSPRERARRLLLDIFSPGNLNITYQGFNTKTAGEVFRVRHANCLGYTNLYIGMTRYAGLTSYYVEVNDLDDVKLLAAGTAVLVRSHICAGVELLEKLELYDFASDLPKKYKRWTKISDREAMAAFLNNRGVELLFHDGNVDPSGRAAAERAFRAALAMKPGYGSALNNLASIYLLDHDYPRAREHYERIDLATHTRGTVLANIGTTYLLEGETERALDYFEEANQVSPKDPFILEKLGVAREKLGELRDAIDAFERAAAYHGRFARPHVSLARIYQKLGDRRRAVRELRLAIEIDGESSEAKDQLESLTSPAAVS